MKNVSLPRLWKLLRWQMPGVLGISIVFAVWVVMFVSFHLIDVGFSDLSEEALREGARSSVDSFWSIAPIMLCISVSNMFNRLSDKRLSYGYLLLPATMQEKFIVSILISTVGMAVLILVGFVVADTLCAGLYYVLLPPVFASGLPSLVDHLLLRTYFVDGHFCLLLLLDDVCPLLWLHSVCVLSAVIARRNAILFMLIPMILLFPLLWLRDQLATELAGGLYDTWTLPMSVLSLLLAVIHYVAAYKLFPRRTLVGHKTLALL